MMATCLVVVVVANKSMKEERERLCRRHQVHEDATVHPVSHPCPTSTFELGVKCMPNQLQKSPDMPLVLALEEVVALHMHVSSSTLSIDAVKHPHCHQG